MVSRRWSKAHFVHSTLAAGNLGASSTRDEFGVHFDLPLVGNFQVDPHSGCLLRANRVMCEVLGYDANALVGRELPALVKSPGSDALRALLASVANASISQFSHDLRMIRKDGSTRWMSMSAAVSQCDARGTPTRITASVLDIDDRRTREESLRLNHQVLSSELHAMESLHQLTIELQQIEDFDVAINHVLRSVAALNHTRSASVHFYREETGTLVLAASCGMAADFIDRLGVLVADPTTPHGYALDAGCAIAVEDIRIERRFSGHAPVAARIGYSALQATPLLARDGRPLGVLCTYWLQPYRIDDHALRLMDLYARQISHLVERRQYEESLIASETGFRAMFESTAVGMAQIGIRSGRFARVNGTLAGMCGYAPGDLVGRTALEVTHPDDVAATRDGFEALVRGEIERYQVEKRILRTHGAPLWVQATMNVVADPGGKPLYIAAILQDISERKQMEHALRDSEQRFRAMADNTSLPIWISSADGKLQFVNQAYLDFFGVERDHIADFDPRSSVHPEDVDTYFSNFAQAVSRGVPWEAAVRVRRADGAWRWLQTRANPILDEANRIVAYVGSSPDLTDLLEAQASLIDADKRKDQFLATLAHELRNPLAPLTASLALLEHKPDSGVDRAVLERMQRQVSHMVRLVDDMMEVSRITRGAIELRRRPMDMAEVLGHCVDSCRPIMEASDHAVVVEQCDPECWVDGDPVRLAQVFSNLLNNAAKYTDPGGRISLGLHRQEDEVVVTVADTGVGLPVDRLDDIFDMFTQLHSASDRSQGGLGIGLTLVRSLVELHGGRISASSEGPGKGSRFTVRLPALTAIPARLEAPSCQSFATAAVRRRILVVDDNRDGADAIAEYLELIQHQVNTAYDGASAVALANSTPPELVLLDLGMPGMDGYETCQRLRGLPGGSAFRIVALSGWGQSTDKARTAASGFDHHLVKPVDLEALSVLLGSAEFFDRGAPL